MAKKISTLLPHNLEAEKAVLGAVLVKPETVSEVIEIIPQSDFFYSIQNRLIFEVILELFKSNSSIDLIILTNYLKKNNTLKKAGGVPYLSELIDNVIALSNIEYYAKIVKDKYIQRSLIIKAGEISKKCFEDTEESPALVEFAEQQIFKIGQLSIRDSFKPLKNILDYVLDDIEKLSKKKDHVPGVPSGYLKLDRITSGFQKSDLIILAGRPSMGKTSFALNIVYNISKHIPTAIFSLEMSGEQLAHRFLTLASKVPARSFKTGYLNEQDWIKITTAASKLAENEIYIDDSYSLSILEVLTKARRLKAEKNIGLIIIDYLQLMYIKKKTESRQLEISIISRYLKSLARELNIPVLVLSQLSRNVESRNDKRPLLSDLRESGAIEQDADLVMFVYRDEKYNEDSKLKGIAEIIVSKHRNGPLGKVKLVFMDEFMAFGNYAYDEEVDFSDEFED